MKTLLHILLILVGIPIVTLIVIFNLTADGMCGNEIYAEEYSPDNRYKAVVFQRDCGSTTGFSTQISIIKMNAALQNKSGNIFVARGHPDVHSPQLTWLSNTELLINRRLDGSEVRAETSLGFINKIIVSYDAGDM